MLRNCFNNCLKRNSVHHATRFLSTKPPPRKESINLLLYSLERFASSSTFQQENFAPFIRKQLADKVAKSSSPHKIYEAVSNFLIHRDFPSEAVMVVQRMQKQGYVPSKLLQAQLALVALAYPVGAEEPIVESLTGYFQSEDCTEKEFLLLFETMNKLEIKSSISAQFVSAFIDSRGEGYKPDPKLLGFLVQASIKAGEFDAAFQTTELMPSTPEGLGAARKAHVAILAAVRDSDTRDASPVNTILSNMKEKGIQPNIAVMNVLLSREVRLGRRSAALRIYRLIQAMAEKDPRVRMDTYTFGSMFSLYRSISPRGLRHHHGDRAIRDYDAYPPRALFRDFMIACMAPPSTPAARKFPFKPNNILLTAALRVFMRHRDYAGALVSLSAFVDLKVPLDNRTWYSVVKLLVRRVWAELSAPPSASSVGWAYSFLGLRDNWRQHHGSNTLDERIVEGVFDTVSRQTFKLMDPLYVPGRPRIQDSERKYGIPTMEMMEAVVPADEANGFVYEVVPLQRLLRRALLAQMMTRVGNEGVVTEADVLEQIVAAQKEMLPEACNVKSSS